LLLLGTVILWSFNYTAVRYGVTHGFAPLALGPVRWGAAGLALAAIARGRGRSLRVGRRDLLVLGAVSLVGLCLNQGGLLYSLHLAPASSVALVFGVLPILISVIAQLIGIERLRIRHWVACGVSFVGVALVAVGAGGTLSGSLGGALIALGTA